MPLMCLDPGLLGTCALARRPYPPSSIMGSLSLGKHRSCFKRLCPEENLRALALMDLIRALRALRLARGPYLLKALGPQGPYKALRGLMAI